MRGEKQDEEETRQKFGGGVKWSALGRARGQERLGRAGWKSLLVM